MFAGVELSSENYDSILTGWSATASTGTDENKILFDGGKSAPSVASNRDSLTAKSWDITDSRTAFITTWEVAADGESITIPTCPATATKTDCTNLTYSYEVDWAGVVLGKPITMIQRPSSILELQLTHIQKKALIRSRSQADFPRIYFA